MVSLVATLGLGAIAVVLLSMPASPNGFDAVYLLGNWLAPFGIVLVLATLSAFTLALTAGLALPLLTLSFARWHPAGPHFSTLSQFLPSRLNCPFLPRYPFQPFVLF